MSTIPLVNDVFDDAMMKAMNAAFDERLETGSATDACTWAAKNMGHNLQLRHVILHPVGLSLFSKHCKNEFSNENISFWMDAIKFQTLSEVHKATQLRFAQAVCKRYIQNDAVSQVNISADQRRHILEAMEKNNVTSTMFDEVLEEVTKMMSKDSFARFKNTPMFDTYLDALVSSASSGTIRFGMTFISGENKLAVHVDEAANLAELEDGKKWDPCMHLSVRKLLDDSKEVVTCAKGKTVKNTSDPKFNDHFLFDIEGKRQGTFLDIFVCYNKGGDKPAVYGYVGIALTELQKRKDSSTDAFPKTDAKSLNDKEALMASMKWYTMTLGSCPQWVKKHYKLDPKPDVFKHISFSKELNTDDQEEESVFQQETKKLRRQSHFQNLGNNKIKQMMLSNSNSEQNNAENKDVGDAEDTPMKIHFSEANKIEEGEEDIPPEIIDDSDDTEEEANEKTVWLDESLGKCNFNIYWDKEEKKLAVHIIRCMELPVGPKNEPISPYLKLYLLNLKGELMHKKRKTEVVDFNSNPIYNSKLYFDIAEKDIPSRQLEITCWDVGGQFIGCVAVTLSTVNLSEDKIPAWRPFSTHSSYNSDRKRVTRFGSSRRVFFSNPGELKKERRASLSLSITSQQPQVFLTKKTTLLPENGLLRTHEYYDDEAKKLIVSVIDCKNLTSAVISESSNYQYFVKCYVLQKETGVKVTKKQKTKVVEGKEPVFDAIFQYNIPSREQLNNLILELSVWKYAFGLPNAYVGTVELLLGEMPLLRDLASAYRPLEKINIHASALLAQQAERTVGISSSISGFVRRKFINDQSERRRSGSSRRSNSRSSLSSNKRHSGVSDILSESN